MGDCFLRKVCCCCRGEVHTPESPEFQSIEQAANQIANCTDRRSDTVDIDDQQASTSGTSQNYLQKFADVRPTRCRTKEKYEVVPTSLRTEYAKERRSEENAPNDGRFVKAILPKVQLSYQMPKASHSLREVSEPVPPKPQRKARRVPYDPRERQPADERGPTKTVRASSNSHPKQLTGCEDRERTPSLEERLQHGRQGPFKHTGTDGTGMVPTQTTKSVSKHREPFGPSKRPILPPICAKDPDKEIYEEKMKTARKQCQEYTSSSNDMPPGKVASREHKSTRSTSREKVRHSSRKSRDSVKTPTCSVDLDQDTSDYRQSSKEVVTDQYKPTQSKSQIPKPKKSRANHRTETATDLRLNLEEYTSSKDVLPQKVAGREPKSTRLDPKEKVRHSSRKLRDSVEIPTCLADLDQDTSEYRQTSKEVVADQYKPSQSKSQIPKPKKSRATPRTESASDLRLNLEEYTSSSKDVLPQKVASREPKSTRSNPKEKVRHSSRKPRDSVETLKCLADPDQDTSDYKQSSKDVVADQYKSAKSKSQIPRPRKSRAKPRTESASDLRLNLEGVTSKSPDDVKKTDFDSSDDDIAYPVPTRPKVMTPEKVKIRRAKRSDVPSEGKVRIKYRVLTKASEVSADLRLNLEGVTSKSPGDVKQTDFDSSDDDVMPYPVPTRPKIMRPEKTRVKRAKRSDVPSEGKVRTNSRVSTNATEVSADLRLNQEGISFKSPDEVKKVDFSPSDDDLLCKETVPQVKVEEKVKVRRTKRTDHASKLCQTVTDEIRHLSPGEIPTVASFVPTCDYEKAEKQANVRTATRVNVEASKIQSESPAWVPSKTPTRVSSKAPAPPATDTNEAQTRTHALSPAPCTDGKVKYQAPARVSDSGKAAAQSQTLAPTPVTVKAPSMSPVRTQASAPVLAPVTALTPAQAPNSAPVKVPTLYAARAPIQAPPPEKVQALTPARSPVTDQMQAPPPANVQTPPPTPALVKASDISPVKAPVQARPPSSKKTVMFSDAKQIVDTYSPEKSTVQSSLEVSLKADKNRELLRGTMDQGGISDEMPSYESTDCDSDWSDKIPAPVQTQAPAPAPAQTLSPVPVQALASAQVQAPQKRTIGELLPQKKFFGGINPEKEAGKVTYPVQTKQYTKASLPPKKVLIQDPFAKKGKRLPPIRGRGMGASSFKHY